MDSVGGDPFPAYHYALIASACEAIPLIRRRTHLSPALSYRRGSFVSSPRGED